MALTDKLTNIADAIREKTGSTRTMNLEGMANAINAIQTGGGGTTDHSKLENRDAADQHPISAITGLEEALTPLIGTAQTVTPSQVLAAIKAGRDIALQYTNSDYGTFVFSAFNANEQQGIVVSNSILPDADGLTGTLVGIVETGAWNFSTTNTATKDDVGTAVNEALAQAKASGEFDGADGKSAYQYAQDGGYTGTEAEFATKLAQEMPSALPNPNALTFTGATTGSYDGSEPLTVEIPSGGGAAVETWDLLINAEITEDCTEVTFNSGDAGETLSDYKELLVLIDLFGNAGGFTTALKIGFLNSVMTWQSPYALNMVGYSADTVKYYINMFRFKKTKYGILPVNRYTQFNTESVSNGLYNTGSIDYGMNQTDFTLPISAKQHVTADMIDFTSQKEFERLAISGWQAVIGAGTIIKVWGMK